MLDQSLSLLSDKAAEAANLLKALSNEKRLLIMCHLIASGELTVGALVDEVGLSQSALSQHLAAFAQRWASVISARSADAILPNC